MQSSGRLFDPGTISRGTELPDNYNRYYEYSYVYGMWPPRDVFVRDGIYNFPWRGSVIFEFVRDACVRAREFAFTTGPRDFWLALTAVWCVRRLHTPHKKRDPIPFVVGCSGELQLSASEVQTFS